VSDGDEVYDATKAQAIREGRLAFSEPHLESVYKDRYQESIRVASEVYIEMAKESVAMRDEKLKVSGEHPNQLQRRYDAGYAQACKDMLTYVQGQMSRLHS